MIDSERYQYVVSKMKEVLINAIYLRRFGLLLLFMEFQYFHYQG